MSQVAKRVHTDQGEIDRIEALAARLPSGSCQRVAPCTREMRRLSMVGSWWSS